MNGPGIGGYQIMDCEWLGPLGSKDSLSELIDCIHYYHYYFQTIESILKPKTPPYCCSILMTNFQTIESILKHSSGIHDVPLVFSFPDY